MKRLRVFPIIVLTVLALLSSGSIAEADNILMEEMTKTHTFKDGVNITVHYSPSNLKLYQAYPKAYADTVLRCAKEAYTEIVYKQGFNTPGFTFANPDRDYCYDKDKTIDIHIGQNLPNAPCYDIIRNEGTDYDAVILFPADRPLAAENIRGTLFHEMLHVILYSYNKNIQPWYSWREKSSSHQGGDWYVEGLARYFETISGYYDNFFSTGFIRRRLDKRVISQKGANFLMEHPSQSLKAARYDYSLFWAYMHGKYGMDKIEDISRRLRFISKANMGRELPVMISAVLKEDFEDVLKGFAVTMCFKRFNPEIKEGLGDLKVMTLDDFSKTPQRRVASWASDFITLDLNKEDVPGVISLKKTENTEELRMIAIVEFKNGKKAQLKDFKLNRTDMICRMDLTEMKNNGVEALMLIIMNSNADHNVGYKIFRY